MRIEKPDIQTHLKDLKLGEGPCWDERTQKLWLVDIEAPALLQYDPATEKAEHWPMPCASSACGLTQDGRIVVALKSGVHLFDPASNALTLLANPEEDRPQNRLNDGKVGPDGRFYIGSMNDTPEKRPTAALYRVDAHGAWERLIDGLVTSNGLAWSLDGRTLYHSDTRGPWVKTHGFDVATGTLSNERVLRSFTNEEGRPDGAATDVEGFYWSAGVTAGCLNRVAPDGAIERKIVLPFNAPTMPCFGGLDLRTLYVTALSRDGQAGGLYSFDPGVAGVPVHRFG